MISAKKDIISRLQKDILSWEGFSTPSAAMARGIGLGPLESAFPNGVFPIGAIHEMLCPTFEQAAATSGLMAGLLAALMQQGRVCLWIGISRKLFPPALINFGIQPDRVVFIDVRREQDVLWAMEEALKCEGLAAVVAEVKEITFAQSRRLQLAVENSKVTGFLLRTDMQKAGATTSVARWQVKSLPSDFEDDFIDLKVVGFPRWQVDLLRVRNGNPGSWKLEWAGNGFLPIDEPVSVPELHISRKVG